MVQEVEAGVIVGISDTAPDGDGVYVFEVITETNVKYYVITNAQGYCSRIYRNIPFTGELVYFEVDD